MRRQKKRLLQFSGDVGRELSWQTGGRSYYTRNLEALRTGHTWCFIVGCNNSGTSLLHSILDRTGAVSTFELEGQRYTRTMVRAARRGHERVWTEFLDELRLTEDDSLDRLPRLLHDWMRELAPPVRSLIVEKTTANAVRLRWLRKAFPNSRFVAMVRNGYAVCEGICRKGENDVRRAARHWNRVNRLIQDDSAHLDNVLVLRYEDLVDAPEATAGRLAGFLGIPAASVASAMAGQFDFATVRGEGFQKLENLNDASIARLSPGDIEIIGEEAAEMLEALGYRRRPQGPGREVAA